MGATRAGDAAARYEPPTLTVLGTVHELTEWCFFGKNIGDPDYFNHIPISNCSA
jgi:hypothetical protein